MTPPGPIKAFPKRLYTVLPRSAAGPSAQRGRSSSFSSSSARSLFTAPPSSLSSLGFFDTPPPPQGKHGHGPLTPSRLPPHSKAELEAPDSPTHHSHSSQSSHSSNGGNGSNGNSGNGAPHSSIALSSTTPSTQSFPPNHSLPTSTHNPPFFPYTPFSTPSPSASAPESETAPDHASSRAAPHKHRTKYHFDVGAMAFRSAATGRGRSTRA
ncbi:hypothetical protein EWM64_g10102 [Hericium alpestre]|uniref:Uncharacterized protein n=1 Tax=Hericium alpestre TaxID=135208 RepID=A0A4Y9ZI92_9AGAM|nr:hypothetical protein EWM64_g10102 [Hericium alpestre]